MLENSLRFVGIVRETKTIISLIYDFSFSDVNASDNNNVIIATIVIIVIVVSQFNTASAVPPTQPSVTA